jgi:hypothetical protein
MGDRAMAPPTRPANFWAPFRPKIRILQAVPAHRVNPVRIFAVSATGCTIRRGFRISRNFRTPITNRATPRLVVRDERPPTDFLGTGGGPMVFAAVQERVAGRARPAERAAESLRRGATARERAHFVIPLFRAVRTKRSQPGILGVMGVFDSTFSATSFQAEFLRTILAETRRRSLAMPAPLGRSGSRRQSLFSREILRRARLPAGSSAPRLNG